MLFNQLHILLERDLLRKAAPKLGRLGRICSPGTHTCVLHGLYTTGQKTPSHPLFTQGDYTACASTSSEVLAVHEFTVQAANSSNNTHCTPRDQR